MLRVLKNKKRFFLIHVQDVRFFSNMIHRIIKNGAIHIKKDFFSEAYFIENRKDDPWPCEHIETHHIVRERNSLLLFRFIFKTKTSKGRNNKSETIRAAKTPFVRSF